MIDEEDEKFLNPTSAEKMLNRCNEILQANSPSKRLEYELARQSKRKNKFKLRVNKFAMNPI